MSTPFERGENSKTFIAAVKTNDLIMVANMLKYSKYFAYDFDFVIQMHDALSLLLACLGEADAVDWTALGSEERIARYDSSPLRVWIGHRGCRYKGTHAALLRGS